MSSAGSRPARIECGALDQDARAARVDRPVRDADHVADGRQIRLVHRLVRLGLAQDADLLVVLEDRVPGVDDPGDGRPGALGLADVGALAGQPEDVVLAADLAGDVGAALGAVEGVLPIGRVVRGERAVDGPRVFPEPGGDDLDEQALAVEDLLDLGDPLERARPVEVGRDDVVVVELDAVEAQLLVRLELAGVLHLLADRRPERVGPGADVPGAEGEAVRGGLGGRGGAHAASISSERRSLNSGDLHQRYPNREVLSTYQFPSVPDRRRRR